MSNREINGRKKCKKCDMTLSKNGYYEDNDCLNHPQIHHSTRLGKTQGAGGNMRKNIFLGVSL